MMKKNQVVRALNNLIFLILILVSCENKGWQRKNKSQYGKSWQTGKDMFYNNCSQCHLPRNKDYFFKSYIDETINFSKKEKINKLVNILIDSNHVEKNIRINTLDKNEIEKYILFIETPQQKIKKNHKKPFAASVFSAHKK